MPKDFIPDSEFVPDSGTPAAASSSPPRGAPDFIPDSSFVSDEEKYGTPSQQAIAGLEGAARGLSLGVSDPLETSLLHNKEAVKGRMQANPVTATTLQVAGAALPIIATAGAAAPEELAAAAAAKGLAAPVESAVAHGARMSLPYLVARAGKAVEGAAGEGLLGRALGVGAEGAAYGAGNAVTDAALGDPHLTAQKVLSDVGMGAAFGAGLGALSKGVEMALPAASKKLAGSLQNLKELTFGTEENPTLLTRAMSVPGSVASGDTPGDWASSFMQGLNPIDRPRTVRDLSKNLQSIYEASKDAASDLYEVAAPANIGKSLEQMPAENAKSIGERLLNEMSTMIEQPGANGEMVPALSSPTSTKVVRDRLEKLALDLRQADSAFEVHSALNTFAKQLDKGGLIKFDTLPTASQMADQEVLRGIRNTIRGSLKDESLWGEAAQHYAQTGEEFSNYLSARKNFQQAFMRKEPASKSFYVDPGKVQTFFNRFNDVGQDVKKTYLNEFLNRAQSLSKASENYYGFKEAEGSLSKRVTELASKNQELTEIAEALKSRARSEAGPGRLGELGAGFAAHALGVPSPIVGAALGTVEAYKAVKNPYELGSTLGRTFNKLKVLGDITESTNKRVASLSKSIFGEPEARMLPAANVGLPSNQGYEKRVARIEELAHQPNTLMDHLSKTTMELQEAAPNVSQGVHATMISAVQFLNSKIPRASNEMMFSPEWEPSRMQKERFQHYYDTVDNPLNVLKDIKKGTLTNESIEALKAVYPKLYLEMQKNLLENFSSKKAKSLGYGTKISISKFLGQPLEEPMQPQVLASNQAIFANTGAAPQSAKRTRKSTLGGLKQLSMASRAAGERQKDRDNET